MDNENLEYYSALKLNEITEVTGKLMDLEYILLSEVIQSQKEVYYMSFLMCGA